MSLRILVAIHDDHTGSGKAELAVDWAARLGGAVVGVAVEDDASWTPGGVVFSGAIAGAGVPPPATAQRPLRKSPAARAENRLTEALQELESRCRQAGVSFRAIRESDAVRDPSEQVVLEVPRHDLVLLGKDARMDPGLGVPAKTIIENVLRHSPRPVVAVPEALAGGAGMLVAYDGSPQASRALLALVASGLGALGKVSVLSIDTKSQHGAASLAAVAVDYLGAHGLAAESCPLVSDLPPAQLIVEEARRRGVELIVMGAYGRARLAEFILGSTTSSVIEQSPIPVFLFH